MPILTLQQRDLLVCWIGHRKVPPPPRAPCVEGFSRDPCLMTEEIRDLSYKVELDWSILPPAIFNKQVLSERIAKKDDGGAVLYSRFQKW
jgi:hypothetical protein